VPASHLRIEANGITHHVVTEGEGPLVLLVHGFPELWYSWRHQLEPLAAAGFRAAAIDVRGYGETDAPAAVESYAMRALCADVAALVGALGEEKAVIVGHDWGAVIARNAVLLHPERFRAVASLSIPFLPRPPAPPLAILRKRFEGQFFYQLYFQEPGVAERELEADVRRSLRCMYYEASGDCPRPGAGFIGGPPRERLLDAMTDPNPFPSWLTDEDLDVFVRAFTRSGFRGPLDRYRNQDRDWEDLAELAGRRIEVPALFIGGDRDLTLAYGIDGMKNVAPDLRDVVILPGAGHWTQQERPRETTEALLRFLR